jgi:hypothetical protein
MKTLRICTVVAIALCALICGTQAGAQNVRGYSDIYYDAESGYVYAEAQTWMDYNIEPSGIYLAEVEMTVQTANDVDVDAPPDEEPDDYIAYTCLMLDPTEADNGFGTYSETTWHSVYIDGIDWYFLDDLLYQGGWNSVEFFAQPYPDQCDYFDEGGCEPHPTYTNDENYFGESQDSTYVCPSSVTLATPTEISLSSQFPTAKTGVGIIAAMRVNPTSTNWNGAKITEAVGPVSNTCPSGFGSCSGSDTFTVGEALSAFNQNFAATQNIFYDEHVSISSVSWLDSTQLNPTGLNSCVRVCTQTYSCGGRPVGTFTITRTFTKGTIQNTPVTNAIVVKQ